MNHVLTKELKRWYWEYGSKREGVEQIPGNWLSMLYEKENAISSIENGQLKPTLAVWGASQTGKSVLMGKIINADDELSSALMWNEELFLFNKQARYRAGAKKHSIKELNPKNNGADASACASRFCLVDSIDDIDYPVVIKLAERQDVLHTLVEGYLAQFSIEDEDVWTVEKIEDLLDDLPSSNATPLKDATELVFDFVSVLDRMITSRNIYVSQLKKRDAWEINLKNRILSDRVLCSDLNKAEEFIQTILWKNDKLLGSTYKKLSHLYKNFKSLTQDKKLKCSLDFASKLLNMDASNNVTDIQKLVNNIHILESNISGDMLLSDSETRQLFFDDKESFSIFQLFVWELVFPLNKSKVDNNVLKTIEALNEFDILDLPGISNFGAANIPLRPIATGDLGNLFKRGKSASIIHKYSESMSISALLLVMRTGYIVSGEIRKQLEDGIHSIWSKLDANYSLGDRNKTPIPVSICFSFFAKAIADYIDYSDNCDDESEKVYALSNYNSFFHLQEYSNPSNTYSFATNYHWFNDGQFMSVNDGYQDSPQDLMDEFMKVNWIRNRFQSTVENESVMNVLEHKDGGIFHLINAQKKILKKYDFYTLKENQKVQLENEVESLLATVVPSKNDNRDIEEQTVTKLMLYLDNRVLELEEERNQEQVLESFEKDVLFISKGLRYILSCESNDLDDITKLKTISGLDDYYVEQLINWEKNAKRMNILGSFGMSAPEQSLILKMLSTRFLPKHDFINKYLKIWQGWKKDARHLTLGEGESYKKIIAKQMSNDLYHKKTKYSNLEDFDNIIKNCEKVYKKNETFRKFGLINIHLDSTIPKLIEHLRLILGEVMVPEREEQIGDSNIVDIEKVYYSTKSDFNENKGEN